MVVDCTPTRVKIKSKLTNLMKITRIEGYDGKYGSIQRELAKFLMISSNFIKSDDELMIEIRENNFL